MTGSKNSNIIATYFTAGRAYEIAHWGVDNPDQHWGDCAVFDCAGQRLADFTVSVPPGLQATVLPYTEAELIQMARQAVREARQGKVSHAS